MHDGSVGGIAFPWFTTMVTYLKSGGNLASMRRVVVRGGSRPKKYSGQALKTLKKHVGVHI